MLKRSAIVLLGVGTLATLIVIVAQRGRVEVRREAQSTSSQSDESAVAEHHLADTISADSRTEHRPLRDRVAPTIPQAAPVTTNHTAVQILAAPHPNGLRLDMTTNAGMTTPDATLETFLWAAFNSETNLVTNIIRFLDQTNAIDAAMQHPLMPNDALVRLAIAMAATAHDFVSNVVEFRVTSRIEEGPFTKLYMEAVMAKGESKQSVFTMMREGSEWRMVFPIEFEEEAQERRVTLRTTMFRWNVKVR